MQEYFGNGNLIPEGAFDSDWLLIITSLPILIYVIVSVIENQPAIWLWKVVFSNKYATNSFRNRSLGSQAGHTLLFIVSLMSLATFAWFCEQIFDFKILNISGFLLWLINIGILSLGLALRFIILSITGKITATSGAFEEYGYNIAQFYKFLAIPLLIINFFIPYLEILPDMVLLVIGITVIVNILVIRTLRLFSIFIRRGFSLLYIILYLCALEFTPILVFGKYLGGAV